ncbi:hypothetical protein K435DRAFT_824909 [Dendrothele bispora CBS 962.96]|uniref:C2H2-type domain-containing protein n=1 Tax=Dendrothele bispora (strain CBS 962.96) TaxID=1314807 RepID=A0A4S8N0L1_DENBC|nr:hypothetical protein K435DRAFT_824909 [Dendrothele bispora CBS 962.96]
MPDCPHCNRFFVTDHALRAHRLAKVHFDYHCTECNRGFIDQIALQQHLDNAGVHQNNSDSSASDQWDSDEDDSANEDNTYRCSTCNRVFVCSDALSQHLRDSPLHNVTTAVFEDDSEDDSEEDSEKDEDEDSNEDDAYCKSCNRIFVDRQALYQHLRDSPLHNWCFICSKDFEQPTHLLQHNASRVHKAVDMECPLCTAVFKSPSDIASHIESGGCNPKITRHHVTAAVHNMDIIPAISVSRRIDAPPSVITVTTYCATQMAFNGKAYVCYLCHDEFRTLQGLNMHLNSPVHDEDQFKCPHGKCGKQFSVISALIRHIESESCGLARFQTVEKYTNQLTGQFSRMLMT